MNTLTLTINKWDTYNPRNDIKQPSWFRMSNSFFEDPDFYDFTIPEMMAWIYLMAQASKKSSGMINVNFAHAQRVGRLTKRDLDSAIEKLQALSIITVHVTDTLRARNADVTDAYATDRQTDITDKTDTRTVTASLNEIYQLYPNKKGKQRGMKLAAKLSPGQLPWLHQAVVNYSAECRRLKTEPRYVKHFSTFMACWEDYVESEGKPERSQPVLKTFDEHGNVIEVANAS